MAKRKEAKKARITKSSGNVFEDLELPNARALLAKTELIMEITKIIRKKNLTQAQAAKILGIDQPKVSALLNGKLTGFSMDRLMNFLVALGKDVAIQIQDHRAKTTSPRVYVDKKNRRRSSARL